MTNASGKPSQGSLVAATLAREFDETFARPARASEDRALPLIALRARGAPYAVSMAEMSGLVADRPVVPLPTPVPELLGLTGVRGGLVPVYGLAALLGGAPDGAGGLGGGREVPRWMLMTSGEPALALAFDELDGHVEVDPADVLPAQAGEARPHVRKAVRLPDGVRPLVDLVSLRRAIERKVRPADPSKER